MTSPLARLHDFGQSFWWDTLSRRDLDNGTVARMRDEDGMRGITSNPSIFKAAIAGSGDYDAAIGKLAAQGKDTGEIFWELAVQDIQDACDILRSVYERSHGEDGFVSLEVDPHLAYDADKTLSEVHRLWDWVDKPNLMVKVPATPAGVPAIRAALEAGRNINVTLLFSTSAHEDVMEAYLAALEARLAKGEPLDTVASVASFFVSRVDTSIDPRLDAMAAEAAGAGDDPRAEEIRALRGKAAIANAKLAYQNFLRVFAGERWERLAVAGARVQRPLWASTSVKDHAYSDVMYVEALIGRDTVDTIPTVTVDAYRDHGDPHADRVLDNVEESSHTLDALQTRGVDLVQVTDQLLEEGVVKFEQAFDELLGALHEKSRDMVGGGS